MNKQYPFAEVQSKVDQSQKTLVVLAANPSLDQVAAGLALFLSLKGLGKTVSIICPTLMTVELNRLVGVDQVSSKGKGTDLVVNFNYLMDQIEKVSYNDEDGKLNLVVQPKSGAPLLTEQAVRFSYSGVSADLIFGIGIKDVGAIDLGNKTDFSNVSLINIDNSQNPSVVGELAVVDAEASCLSEIVLGLISGSNWTFNQDIAQNILSGIWKSSRGLSAPDLSADTYEAVAVCLRSGAHKPVESFPPRTQEFRQRPPDFQPRPPRTFPKPEEKSPVVPQAQPPKQTPPPDWFEPKIYRGTNIS